MTFAYSQLQFQELDAPGVPVMLGDGIIPIEYLDTPITVTLKVWAAARPGFTYQLLWNEQLIGPEKSVLPGELPGSPLELEIPQRLLIEGVHQVAYQTKNPESLVTNQSQVTLIKIDRTQPGAPQLAPIIFPPAIQDGLTSSELESMNDVLVGQIAGYTGMQEHDLVQTYWGNVAGPTVLVDKDDMGLKRVNVGFSRRFLKAIGDIAAPVHYTVKDLAGNVSMDSDPIIVKLQLSVLPVLPVPDVKEANGNILDPANATRGATVLIAPSAELKLNDLVLVQWEGPKGSDTKEKIIAETDVGKELALVFSAALVTVNDGGTVSISYVVSRSNGAEQQSNPFLLQIQSGLRQLPAPLMDNVGPDGIVVPGKIPESGATVRVAYQDMQATDSVVVSWKGVSAHDTAPQLAGSAAQLQFNLPKSVIIANVGNPATLTYTVTRAAASLISAPLQLTVNTPLVFDTSPVTLHGRAYLMPHFTGILPVFPADATVQRVASGGQPPYVYSSNTLAAKVDDTGLVTPRGNGPAVITVTDVAGDTSSYTVTWTNIVNCFGLNSGSQSQMAAAAVAKGGRLPTIDELHQIHGEYGNRWPMGNGTYWSSTVAADPLGIRWYYVKNLVTGENFKLLHHNASLAIALVRAPG